MGFTINDELDYSRGKYPALTTHFASFKNSTGGSSPSVIKTSKGNVNADGTADLIGDNTTFLTDFAVDEAIYVGDTKMTVVAITDDTHITVSANVTFGSYVIYKIEEKRVLSARLHIWTARAKRFSDENGFVSTMNITCTVNEDAQMTAAQVMAALYTEAKTKFTSTTDDE